MKGAILDKGQDYFTYLDRILPALEGVHLKYNWLISCLTCDHYSDDLLSCILDNNCAWLTGEQLEDIVYHDEIQFIWAVLSAFDKSITLDDVLKHELPCADGYKGFWYNPVTIQHPKAEIEIVPWDSSLVLLIAKDNTIAENFLKYFPMGEDLENYNTHTKLA